MSPVAVLVGPGQHSEYLVRGLMKRKILRRVMRCWPNFEIWEVSAQNDMVLKKRLGWYRHLTWLTWVLWRRIPRLGKYEHPKVFLWGLFDRIVSRHLEGCDVVLGWSQVSLHTLRKAKDRGMVTILEHPMSHALKWLSLVRPEYEQYAPKASWYFSLWPRPLVRRMLKEYEAADAVHVCSTFAARTFIEQGVPPERVLCTPLTAVDPSVFRPDGRDKEKFVVLYCGRIELQKGVHYLLRAFAELGLSDAELWLVGPILPEAELILRKYEGYFRHLGSVRREDLAPVYNLSSVFVLPSVNDGFGLVILEAMACGVPVIATENTGGPDVIRDGVDGFIVPIRDVEALKEKILWLYEHRDAGREMGMNARRRVEENFTVEHYGERLVANIEALVRKVRG